MAWAMGGMEIDQLAYHKGLEEFECQMLWQSTFMQPKIQANTNDTAPRVIHPLAEQITPESPLFPTEHVGQTFEGPSTPVAEWVRSAGIIKKRIACLL